MDSIEKFRGEFIENSCYRMEESLRMVTISLDQISEEQLWLKPNSSLNSTNTIQRTIWLKPNSSLNSIGTLILQLFSIVKTCHVQGQQHVVI